MRRIISFLGSGRYQPARYCFEGETWPATPYFGLALARHQRPDQFILLGTPGSMWDVLLSDHLQAGADYTEAHHALMECAKAAAVSQAQLDTLRPLLEAAAGCPVLPRIIPDCREAQEQAVLLATLAELTGAGDHLTLDVTHGYRHLPMLGLVAAAYLRACRGVRIERILYGALQMQDAGVAPVLDLRGLLEILDWVQALAAYDASGNLNVLCAPLAAAGLPEVAARALEQAAFDERNLNTEGAVPRLNTARQAMARLPPHPAFDLFRPALESRLAWTVGGERWRHEAALGHCQLERGDYLRAAALFSEAVVSRQLGLEAGSRAAREAVALADSASCELRDLRNALAHGNPSRDSRQRGKIAKLAGSRQHLGKRLEELAVELDLPRISTTLPNRAAHF